MHCTEEERTRISTPTPLLPYSPYCSISVSISMSISGERKEFPPPKR